MNFGSFSPQYSDLPILTDTIERLRIRIHGDAGLPTLIYLPGLHGDWTLVSSFRRAMRGQARFVEFTYPRTLTWSLDDYAEAVGAGLIANGITHGWLLGESFGSQIVWPLTANRPSGFVTDGIILAGGFGKHPFKPGVVLAGRLCHGISLTLLTRLLFGYAKFARFRHRHAPETLASISEFIARRTELDKCAGTHRLRLIAANDPRLLAARVSVPVHHLGGFWDPIVPWPLVRPWLRRHCPGYRGGRVIASADHNVLGTAPQRSARIVLAWMRAAEARS